MKSTLTALLIIVIRISVSAGNPIVNYEWFSLGGNFVYSIEDNYTGLNGKLSFPLSSRNISFVFQGTLFPAQMQLGEETFDEIRSKIGIQITPIHIGKFSMYAQAGFDNGTWRRNFDVLNSQLGNNWKIDKSMMFGAGFNYDHKGVRFYADWMYMPEVYSNHLGIGMHILFFEKKLYRKFYMQRRKSGSWINYRKRRSKSKGSSIKL